MAVFRSAGGHHVARPAYSHRVLVMIYAGFDYAADSWLRLGPAIAARVPARSAHGRNSGARATSSPSGNSSSNRAAAKRIVS